MTGIVPTDPSEPLELEHRYCLEKDYPNCDRILTAFRLAKDLDTCRRLLAGQPVDQDRLDRNELFRAQRRSLVQFVAPIDLLLEDAS